MEPEKESIDSGYMAAIKPVLKKLTLGQVIALCIAITGIVNEQITSSTRNNVNAPALTTISVYLLLLPFCTIPYLLENIKYWRNLNPKLLSLFLCLAILDVEANWFIVKAYQYTSILYAQVLDASIIPMAMLLSVFILRVRFKVFHYFGAVLCVLGSTLLCFSTILLPCDKNDESLNATVTIVYNHTSPATTLRPELTTESVVEDTQLLGNLLVIVSSGFYASSNVLQEWLVKTRPETGIAEVRASFGGFGPIIVILQLFITGEIWTEVDSFQQTEYFAETLGLISLFGLAMLVIYFVMPLALSETSAIFVNLSMLTADMYAVLIGYFIYGNCVSWMYLVGFTIIDGGIVAYNFQNVDARQLDELDEESMQLSSQDTTE